MTYQRASERYFYCVGYEVRFVLMTRNRRTVRLFFHLQISTFISCHSQNPRVIYTMPTYANFEFNPPSNCVPYETCTGRCIFLSFVPFWVHSKFKLHLNIESKRATFTHCWFFRATQNKSKWTRTSRSQFNTCAVHFHFLRFLISSVRCSHLHSTTAPTLAMNASVPCHLIFFNFSCHSTVLVGAKAKRSLNSKMT